MKKNGTGRRVVQLFQSGPQDNGQTALAMVLNCLGCPVSPWELEPVESAADLVKQARARGIYAEGCQTTIRELCAAPLPAIAHWRFQSFVVVSRIRGGRVWINDPEDGLRVLSLKEFEAGFTGAVVCFAGQGGAHQDAPPPRARTFFARFPAASLLMGLAQVFICVCCSMAVIALQMSIVGVGGTVPLLLTETLLILAASLFQLWLRRRCERGLRRQAARYCAERLEEKPPLFFRRVQMYQVAYACESCGTAGAAMAGLALDTMRLWTAALCLALLAVQDIWAAAAALPAAAVFTAAVRSREDTLCSEAKRAGRDRFVLKHQAAERMDRMDSLRGEHRRYFEQWLYGAGSARTAPQTAGRLSWYWCVFAALETALALCAGMLHRAAGGGSAEKMAGCAGTALLFAWAMSALPRRVEARALLRSVQETFACLFREGTAQQSGTSAPPSVDGAETLTVQSVDLPPAREGDVGFRDVSLTVRRGEVLSVLVTGGDRLALSRLIAGIAAPAQGAVYLGGTDVKELRQEELFRRITLLGRGVPIPFGTVRENIAAGCGDISDLAVAQAASHALLHERLLLREKGYDTPAGLLSSGEQVLLEFACAFARGTPFLVADGCTGRLDAETERALMDEARRRGLGVVLVADGGTPFRWADAVCRIEDGHVTLLERAEIVDWGGQTLVQSK